MWNLVQLRLCIYCSPGLRMSDSCCPRNAFRRPARQYPESRHPAVQPRSCFRGLPSRKRRAFCRGEGNSSAARGGAGFQHPVFGSVGQRFCKRVGIQTWHFRPPQGNIRGFMGPRTLRLINKVVGCGLGNIYISSKTHSASHI